MKITPAAAPAPVQPSQSSAQDARARAIAKLTATAAPTPAPENPIVQNQNAISPEETSAVMSHEESDEDTQMDGNPHEERVEEPKVTEPTPESRRFAQLARQEKALRQQAQQVKAQQDALAARQAELDAREQSYKAPAPVDQTKYVSRDQFKLDPISALNELGLNYEELTNAYLNHTPQDPRVQATISNLEAKLAKLEAAAEAQKQQSVDSQTQQYQAAIKQLKTDTKALVDNDPNFETIKATRSHDDVVDLIEQTYKKDGILLSVQEAADMVEEYLLEEAMQLTKISKIKAKLAASSAPTKPAPAVQPSASANQPKQPQMKTLTNNTASTRQLSSKERAILAFKGQLK